MAIFPTAVLRLKNSEEPNGSVSSGIRSLPTCQSRNSTLAWEECRAAGIPAPAEGEVEGSNQQTPSSRFGTPSVHCQVSVMRQRCDSLVSMVIFLLFTTLAPP